MFICLLVADDFYFYCRERNTGFSQDSVMILLAFRVAYRPRGRLIESARPEFFRGKRNTISLRPDPIPRQTLRRKREKRGECAGMIRRVKKKGGGEGEREERRVEKQREKWSCERGGEKNSIEVIVSFAERRDMGKLIPRV